MKGSFVANALIINVLFIMVFAGCKDDDRVQNPQPNYEIPDTYNFTNVNYNGQEQRLSQFYELVQYMGTARTQGVSLDAVRLIGMYENDSVAANWQGNYDASKQIKDKTQLSQQDVFALLLQNLAQSSSSMTNAYVGQAGIAVTNDGQSSYLLNANGVEEAQLIEKGLMGAFLYYQIAAVYLGNDKMNVDNTTITPGEGTTMEHHWDEAFGYYGVPADFPGNTDNILFWGSYSNNRNGVLQCNKNLMDAFIKGRAAVSNSDYGTRDAMRPLIRDEFEQITAASAIHYLNTALNNFSDTAKRSHVLSEATGFIYALQFNPDKSHTNEEIMGLIDTFAGSKDLTGINLYGVKATDLESVRDTLADWYGFADIKESL